MVKAFYETDPDVCNEIQESYRKLKNFKAKNALAGLDPGQFKPGIDIGMMYREMYLASEGYLWEMMRKGPVDVEKMEEDFTGMLAFWKKIYLKEGSV